MATRLLTLGLICSWLLTSVSHGATIIVPDDQPTVQDAVDVAASGDVIQVRPGSISDRVRVVSKTNLTIETLGGIPVFPPANRKDGFDVRSSSGVTISGFAFQNRKTAVRLTDCTNCRVTANHVDGCREGVYGLRSSGLSIDDNLIEGTGKGRGIQVADSPDAVVALNQVLNGKGDGIRVSEADGSLILDNTSNGNSRGLEVRRCVSCDLVSNETNGNRGEGVRVADAEDGSVVGGTSNDNGSIGIRIDQSPAIEIDTSEASRNGGDGMRIDDCAGATVTSNDADDNDDYGIRVGDSPPIDTPQDLIDAGNTAAGNGSGDLRVDP